MHDRLIIANRKKLIVRSCGTGSDRTKAIIFAHGRFQPHMYLIGEANIIVPPSVTVYHYIHHNEALQSRMAYDLYYAMQDGRQNMSPIKEYAGEKTIKNYTLRPDPLAQRLPVSKVGQIDLILPQEIMRTSDILEAITTGTLRYRELHFLTCRATRLTASLPI